MEYRSQMPVFLLRSVEIENNGVEPNLASFSNSFSLHRPLSSQTTVSTDHCLHRPLSPQTTVSTDHCLHRPLSSQTTVSIDHYITVKHGGTQKNITRRVSLTRGAFVTLKQLYKIHQVQYQDITATLAISQLLYGAIISYVENDTSRREQVERVSKNMPTTNIKDSLTNESVKRRITQPHLYFTNLRWH